MTERPPREPIWTMPFLSLFVINFMITFAQFFTLALVPKLAQSLGASSLMVGVVAGVFAVTALAVRPAVGWATLVVRHSYLLAGTVVLILIAFVLYALADSIPVLIAARLLHGAAMGFLAPVTLAMASDALPSSRMAQGIGTFSLGQAVSTAVGPSVGLWMLANFGYPISFFIGAGVMLISALLALRLRSAAPQRTTGVKFRWSTFVAREALLPAAIMFFLAGAFSGVNSFIVLYGEARGVEQIGLFFAAYAIFILVSRPIAGAIGDTRGLAVVIIPGMVLFAISFIVIAHVDSLVGFLIAGAVSALGYGICQPAIQTLALTAVPAQKRGLASNTNYIGVDLGYLIMPIVGGWIVATQTDAGMPAEDAYATMYLACIVPVTLGMTLYILSLRHRRPRPAQTPAEA
ncbi:MFS transporter [Microbacterium sp. BG28]|uniref:MFS transporter n=1 Tax=Microbacterium sp. BG28 TaxID=3097356 RepID=UPI002A59B7FC|nr:MFS transporter [Microbacterium sp. BG28]MDY0828507.1 MFS transporter [Microbacterium sp. BG28]